MSQKRSGVFYLKVDGNIYDVKGNFTYNLGAPKREAIVGDKVHGFKETVQVPFIEGEIIDSGTLDLETLVTLDDVTGTLELANGKVIVLRNAWYAGEGTVGTDDANVQFRLEGISAEEVR